ncbi:MAG: glycosyltransferase, partial [Planctomycetota bacterium]|nr:glycosyltransferase [Planctomycetota bacterium]
MVDHSQAVQSSAAGRRDLRLRSDQARPAGQQVTGGSPHIFFGGDRRTTSVPVQTIRTSLQLLRGVSVIVPVYNSEGSLRLLVEELALVLPKCGEHYELILVNDGSRDTSWQVIQKLAAEFRWIRAINMMRNFGQHNAILCGVREAQCDTIVTMDDD